MPAAAPTTAPRWHAEAACGAAARRLALGLLSALVGAAIDGGSGAQPTDDPAAGLRRATAAAEAALRAGELQAAESHSRDVLLEGHLLLGQIQLADDDVAAAQATFERAANVAAETARPRTWLAFAHLQRGEAEAAAALLTGVVGRQPANLVARRLLAQALIAAGQPEQALQELEEARAAAPEDLELAFTLATGYLRLKRPEAAERLFAQVLAARPQPQTRVLIGRMYRDFGEWERARTQLQAALRQDPQVRRAHDYLGTVEIFAEGGARLDAAMRHFRAELELAPRDGLANLHLGMALLQERRYAEALPALEIAAGAEPPLAVAFHYYGRCLLGLERAREAVAPLRRAALLARAGRPDNAQLGSIHYHLALALRRTDAPQEAEAHFAEAERYSSRVAESSRERLASYLVGGPDPELRGAVAPPLELALVGALPPAARAELQARTRGELARAYLNLGVMQAQAQRFARAAALFDEGAALQPDFPQLQYALGVARFNAGDFERAVPALERAVAAAPGDAARRLLALAAIETDAPARAAELLQADPQRERDPALQYAYGLALVRSGRAAEAHALFTRLLAAHADAPELRVVLGQAQADQGDFEAAERELLAALRARADVPEANATLGVLYLKQGRLEEAERALRAELRHRPLDRRAQFHLATVLDLRGQPAEAQTRLRALLRQRPTDGGARYLLGKILLAQGAAQEALEQLEAAARLTPDEANVRYQLAQAYRKLGRAGEAEREFEAFRQLKDKRRGGVS